MLELSHESSELSVLVADFLSSKGRTHIGPIIHSTSLSDDLALDSLEKFELMLKIENSLKVAIDPDHAFQIDSVGELKEYLDRQQQSEDGAGGSATGFYDLEKYLATTVPQFLRTVDEQRERSLRIEGRWITDFASANYLGLDLHPAVKAAIEPAIAKWGVHPSWTRVVASPAIYDDLERKLADFVGVPETLVFPTVTLTHMGVLPLLVKAGDSLLLDEHGHRSLHEAAAVVSARGGTVTLFRHGDSEDLEQKLAAAAGSRAVIVACDGVYSMTGEELPLAAMLAQCRRHGARLYVDDAHGFGVLGADPTEDMPYGRGGGGLLRKSGVKEGLEDVIYVAGLSKSFSSLAAFVSCRDAEEKQRLSAAATWVFSGPCQTASLATAIAGLDISLSAEGEELRAKLLGLTRLLVTNARELGFVVENQNLFPLVSIVIGSVKDVVEACRILWRHGILITPAVYPTVPLHRSMLRFTLTAANNEEQVFQAIEALAEIRDLIPAAPYA